MSSEIKSLFLIYYVKTKIPTWDLLIIFFNEQGEPVSKQIGYLFCRTISDCLSTFERLKV